MPSGTPPPLPLPAAERDAIVCEERLRLLAIGYFTQGALTALTVSILLFSLLLDIGLFFVPESPAGDALPGLPSPRVWAVIIAAVSVAVIVGGWAIGGLTCYAGRCLQQRRRPLFIKAVALLQTGFLPYGTLLGVATFLLLNKPAVRAWFVPPATLAHPPVPDRA